MSKPLPDTARARILLLQGFAALVFLLLLAWEPAPAFSFDTQKVLAYAQQRYGSKGAQGVKKWQAMLEQAANLPEQQKLRVVNDFWNRALLAGEDINIWQQTDYWATPLQSLVKGAGDCEDYVIGKYFSLLRLGVPADKLRFVYVKAQIGMQSIAHMVLGYYPSPGAEPLVLDNLIDLIQPAGARPDLTPVFSFNGLGVYMPGGKRSSVDSIGRWRDLLARMRAEGFEP